MSIRTHEFEFQFDSDGPAKGPWIYGELRGLATIEVDYEVNYCGIEQVDDLYFSGELVWVDDLDNEHVVPIDTDDDKTIDWLVETFSSYDRISDHILEDHFR